MLALYSGGSFGFVHAQHNDGRVKPTVVYKILKKVPLINKGSKDGLFVGQELRVIRRYRGGGTVHVGKAKVRALGKKIAAIRVVQFEDGQFVQVGDVVLFDESPGVTIAELDGKNGQNGAGHKQTGLTGVGLKAGLNVSNFSRTVGVSNRMFGAGAITGASAGGFLTYRLTPAFAFQPEVLYTMKGADIGGTLSQLSVNYVEVPLLLKLTVPSQMGPNLFVGPTFSYKLWSRRSAKIETLNVWDYGFVFGLGVNAGPFTVDTRFILGMPSIAASPGILGIRNNVFSIMAGYSF